MGADGEQSWKLEEASWKESFLTADNADEHGRKEKEPSSQNLALAHSGRDYVRPF